MREFGLSLGLWTGEAPPPKKKSVVRQSRWAAWSRFVNKEEWFDIITFHIRMFRNTDSDFVLSLVSRFSEFELPDWRSDQEIDNANRVLLQKSMQQPESDSVIFVAEDENGVSVGFIHLQTQTDYFNGEKHAYISDLAVDKRFEGKGIGSLLLDTAEEWVHKKGYHFLTLYVFAGNQL